VARLELVRYWALYVILAEGAGTGNTTIITEGSMFLQNGGDRTVMLTEGSMFLQNGGDRTVMLTVGSMFLQNGGDRTVMLTEGGMFLQNGGDRTVMLTEGSMFLQNGGDRTVMVDKVTMERILTMYISIPCRYNSTNAPYSFIQMLQSQKLAASLNDTQSVIIQKATNLNLLQ
jgi:environmental stress-induced protein Ves